MNLLRSLHDVHKEATDRDRRTIDELCRWHQEHWDRAEDCWRQYVSTLSKAREMQHHGTSEVLRRAEAGALDLISTLICMPTGSLCPFCQRAYPPSNARLGSNRGE
ncbi:hypothetical protein GCM10022245_01350 [Streptomyces mayteni]